MTLNGPSVSEWTCPHGTTYSGTDDFISGAKNAHDEMRGIIHARVSGLEQPPKPEEAFIDARVWSGWKAALSAVREALGVQHG